MIYVRSQTNAGINLTFYRDLRIRNLKAVKFLPGDEIQLTQNSCADRQIVRPPKKRSIISNFIANSTRMTLRNEEKQFAGEIRSNDLSNGVKRNDYVNYLMILAQEDNFEVKIIFNGFTKILNYFR